MKRTVLKLKSTTEVEFCFPTSIQREERKTKGKKNRKQRVTAQRRKNIEEKGRRKQSGSRPLRCQYCQI